MVKVKQHFITHLFFFQFTCMDKKFTKFITLNDFLRTSNKCEVRTKTILSSSYKVKTDAFNPADSYQWILLIKSLINSTVSSSDFSIISIKWLGFDLPKIAPWLSSSFRDLTTTVDFFPAVNTMWLSDQPHRFPYNEIIDYTDYQGFLYIVILMNGVIRLSANILLLW